MMSLLDDWSRRVSDDPVTREWAAAAGTRAEALVRVTGVEPDFFLLFAARGKHLTMRCFKTTSRAVVARIDAATLHRILSGIQNLMILLNERRLDELVEGGMDESLLRLLLDVQPAMARAYRDALHARGERV